MSVKSTGAGTVLHAAALAEKVELALGSDDVWLLTAAEEAALFFRALDGWLEDVGNQRLGDILYELRAEAELRNPQPASSRLTFFHLAIALEHQPG